jgi:group I intron endonuclease
MTNLFNKLNYTPYGRPAVPWTPGSVAFNASIKAVFNPFVAQFPFYEQTYFFSTKNNNKENKLDIQFKTWLIDNKPAKVYLNSATSKNLIYTENCSKSGIYLWYNNINGKYYVGSSINLKHRFYYYFSPTYLKKNKFLIQRALMSHTHDNFSLYVLEYCEIKDLISREQYYIDLLTPPYNINPTAYSRLGSKHVEESKELMRINNLGKKNPMFGKTHSIEYRAILSERMTNNNPMAGKPCKEEVKAIIKKVQSIPLYIYDVKTKLLLFKYDSQKEFIKVFKVSPKTVIKYINTSNIFREQYILSSTLLDKTSIKNNVFQDKKEDSRGK